MLCIVSLITGCGDLPFQTVDPPCEDRADYYPDADDDGVGDPGGEVYVTCEDPGEGWTRTPPEESDDTDVGDTDVEDTDG